MTTAFERQQIVDEIFTQLEIFDEHQLYDRVVQELVVLLLNYHQRDRVYEYLYDEVLSDEQQWIVDEIVIWHDFFHLQQLSEQIH